MADKFTYVDKAEYEVLTSDPNYIEDFYQVIDRFVQWGYGEYRGTISFCGSDKEGRLLANAQEMYNMLVEVSDKIDPAVMGSYILQKELTALLNRIDNG